MGSPGTALVSTKTVRDCVYATAREQVVLVFIAAALAGVECAIYAGGFILLRLSRRGSFSPGRNCSTTAVKLS